MSCVGTVPSTPRVHDCRLETSPTEEDPLKEGANPTTPSGNAEWRHDGGGLGRLEGGGKSTYRDADVNQKVGTDEAIADLCGSIVDSLLRQANGTIDQERLAEVEGCKSGTGRNGLEHGPLQHAQ